MAIKKITQDLALDGANLTDVNGIKLISFPSAVTSAVNYINVSNSITGVGPTIKTDGTDLNINLNLVTKGTGLFILTSTSSLKLPIGTTLERPTGEVGMIRYNSTTTKFELYENGAWINIQPLNSSLTTLSSLGTALQLIRVNSGGTGFEYFTPTYISSNQTITLSGEASGSGTTAITVTLDNASVIGKVLTGLSTATSGTIAATDTILAAFGKLQHQITNTVIINSIGTINSLTKSSNGAVISGSSLVFQTADENNPGMISTTAQNIAGEKTFLSKINTPTGTVLSSPGSIISSRGDITNKFTGTRILFVDCVKSSITGTTTETTLATFTLPAGTVNANSIIRLTFFTSYSNSTNGKTFKVRMNTTDILVNVYVTSTNGFRRTQDIAMRNSLISQIAWNVGTNNGYGTTTGGVATFAIDFSLAVTFDFTAMLANIADTASYEFVMVEMLN